MHFSTPIVIAIIHVLPNNPANLISFIPTVSMNDGLNVFIDFQANVNTTLDQCTKDILLWILSNCG